jgi:hypothetical protein
VDDSIPALVKFFVDSGLICDAGPRGVWRLITLDP